MKELFRKSQLLTLPNLLSLARLGMIPVIGWLYLVREDPLAAVGLLLLSGLTDVADGIIARRWNMVSDLGKILDPVADKLTQLAVAVCLISRYRLMGLLAAVFVGKELVMLWLGSRVLREKAQVHSAQWHGKVNTVVLYLVLGLLILVPGIPERLANAMILTATALAVFSLLRYVAFYGKILGKTEERVWEYGKNSEEYSAGNGSDGGRRRGADSSREKDLPVYGEAGYGSGGDGASPKASGESHGPEGRDPAGTAPG